MDGSCDGLGYRLAHRCGPDLANGPENSFGRRRAVEQDEVIFVRRGAKRGDRVANGFACGNGEHQRWLSNCLASENDTRLFGAFEDEVDLEFRVKAPELKP